MSTAERTMIALSFLVLGITVTILVRSQLRILKAKKDLRARAKNLQVDNREKDNRFEGFHYEHTPRSRHVHLHSRHNCPEDDISRGL